MAPMRSFVRLVCQARTYPLLKSAFPATLSSSLQATPARSFQSSSQPRSDFDFPISSSPTGAGPSPPRLPKEDQELFERLQREAMATPDEPSLQSSSATDSYTTVTPSGQDSRMLHPHVRAAIKPDFVGDTNPKTGEVGGPKNEPLKWGSAGDWSYGGRVTDF